MPGVGGYGSKTMLISTGGGDVLSLLLLLSDSFDSIILARAVSYPKDTPTSSSPLALSMPNYFVLIEDHCPVSPEGQPKEA
jgi:hypothetical protein